MRGDRRPQRQDHTDQREATTVTAKQPASRDRAHPAQATSATTKQCVPSSSVARLQSCLRTDALDVRVRRRVDKKPLRTADFAAHRR